MSSRFKSIKSNTLLNGFRMLLTVLVPLITFPYTSRIFLSEGSGKISFASSVVQIFILFASLGIYTYGVREGSKIRNNRNAFTEFACEMLLLNVFSTIIAYVIFIILLLFYLPFYEYKDLLIIYGISIGFTALGMDWVYGVYEDYMYITVRQIIVQIFSVICLFIFIRDKGQIYVWAVINVISTVGANVFNFYNSRKYINYGWLPKNLNISRVKLHIKPVLILFATSIATKIYSNIDVVLLGVMANDRNVGLYSAAIKINTILITCFTAMSPVFIPRIVELVRNNNDNEYDILLRKIFEMMFLIGLPCVMGLLITSDSVIYMIGGADFAEASATIKILSPIILLTALTNTLYCNVLVVKKKELNILFCTGIAGVINIVLSICMIPHLKENGAAFGSLFSEIIALCLAYYFCKKSYKKMKNVLPNVWRYFVASILLGMICIIINYYIASKIISLILDIVFGGMVYIVFLIVSKDALTFEIWNWMRRKSLRKDDQL